jgi:hypothetical protein
VSHLVCPACGGGRSSERSAVTYERDGVVFYKCYRASCSRPSGVLSGVHTGVCPPRPALVFPKLQPLSAGRLKWIEDKFHLTNEDVRRLRPLWTDSGRYWYPIRSASGAELGGVARSYTSFPKSLTYQEDWGTGSWYGSPSDEVWVVEDQVSACKMAQHHMTVALLGTGLAPICRESLVALGKPIVLALDGDALAQSVRLSEKLQSAGCNTRVVYLEKDIKNLYPDEVKELARAHS